jgi:D-lyxose ketol-isomerase
MNRRNWFTNTLATAAGLAAVAVGSKAQAQAQITPPIGVLPGKIAKYPNARFYKADGSFNAEEAKKAYVELLKFHNYSLADVVNDERFWIVDFGLGDFANVGMAGIFWLNDKENGYFGHEIFLLPGQMIPEHAHVAAEGKPAKHEYWQVRYGSIYNFGAGGSKDDPLPAGVVLPKSQLDAGAITAFKCVELKATTGLGKGEAVLNEIGAYHFMMGGPEGTIVTEYANYHSGEGLRLRNPKAKL